MKNLGKFATLGAVLAVSASSVFAATITLGSYSTSGSAGTDINTAMTFNGFSSFVAPPADPQPNHNPDTGIVTTTTYTLNPLTVWSAPLANSTWVGYAPTAGPQATVNPPYGYYTFNTTFSLGAGVYSGSLSVMADDTTEVFLNGTKIVSFGNLGGDSTCADNSPTCQVTGIHPTPAFTVGLNGLTGNNTLTFVVEQAGQMLNNAGNDPSGFDFSASLAPSATPEPSSLVLLGTGLMGAAGMLFRRRVIA